MMADLDDKPKSGGGDSELSNSITATGSIDSVDSRESAESRHSLEGYTGDAPELQLTPHVSRVSERRHRSRSRSKASLARTQTAGTSATANDPAFEVDFEDEDRGNPMLWPLWYKCVVIFAIGYGTTVCVMFSTSYTAPIPGLVAEFGITEQTGVLGVTTYLLGMALGSIVLAPISEMYGRRPVYVVSLALFTILIIPCALARNFTTILASRFFCAFAAAAMISNAPGSISDMVPAPYRPLAFSLWSLGPMEGPVYGPIMGGWVYQTLSWRWTYWIVLILAGISWIVVSIIPETYPPTILRKRAHHKRKTTGDMRYFSRYDDKLAFWPLLKTSLARPIVMFLTEWILLFWDFYIALVYGLLYLCFVAYPIVFSQQRGWSPGISGLAFIGISIGVLITIASEPLIRRVINAHKPDPETGKPPPEAMVFPVCIAALLMPIGQLIFAWTSTPNIHWAPSIIAGIPFGAGCTAIFIYASNYLVHSYGIYAASALASNALLRSIMGATLPLAGPSMYARLGSNWAGTLLAILGFVFVPIPFVFYKYGAKIRLKSTLIREMQEDQDRQERKRRKILQVSEEDGVIVDQGPKIEEEEKAETIVLESKGNHGAAEMTGRGMANTSALDSADLEKGQTDRGRGREL